MRHFVVLSSVVVSLVGLAYASEQSSSTAWIGPSPPSDIYPAGEEDRQFAMLADDLTHRDAFRRVAAQTFRPEALILDSDRDPLDVILRRAEALLADLRRMPKPPDLRRRRRRTGRPAHGRRRHRREGPGRAAGRSSTRPATSAAASPWPTRCWTSRTSCSSSGSGAASITCATSSTASPSAPAEAFSCWQTPSGPSPRSATCWPGPR